MNSIFDIIEYIVIMILIAVIIYLYYENKRAKNNNVLEWINQGHPSGKYGSFNPTQRLNDVISKYGIPDVIDKKRGGSAIWKKSTLENKGACWDRIEIRDEQIPHESPGPHVDFLYYWYKLNVPEELICDITKLSESVTYDTLKKMLRVRCHFSGAIVSTMVLAKRISTKEITLDEAKKAYGLFIFSTMKGHEMYNPDAEESMIKELCEHKNNQKWKI